MLESQTEPTIEQKQQAKAQNNLTHDENCILVCLLKQGYTWRYASTISSETGISQAEAVDYLHNLKLKGFAKNDSGTKGEIWSITALGKSVQEQHQTTGIKS
jgi:predicted transcriptional regulator